MRLFIATLGLLVILLAWLPATALAGGPITSGEVVSGTLSNPTYSESWTFSGTTGNRVLIAAVLTSGSANTVVRLRDPLGTDVVVTGTDRVDYQLLQTGTYTLTIEDSGFDQAGTYNLGLLNVTAGPLSNGSDPDGGAIGSSEVKTGQMHQVADFDAFTFSATTGDRVVFGALATGGASFDTNVTLYPPNGGPAEVANGGNDRLDAKLLQSGTYTVVIEDGGNDASGNYSVSLLNLTAGPLTNGSDTDGGTISSADVVSANFSSAPDFDAWHFTGTNGNRVLIAAVATSASGQNTVIYLYPPGGGNPLVATGTDRSEAQLNATGTWTILVEDLSLDSPGSYSLGLLNVTAGPLTNGSDPNGGAIGSSEVKTGQMHQVADFDAFTFSATTGDRVVFGALATGGASFDTNVTLYPPNGGPAEVANGGNDRLDAKLLQSGTYTVVIEDSGNDASGNYSVSLLNLTAGPLTNGSDTDGGTISSADVVSANFSSAPDFDAWHFTGTNGNRVLIAAVATSASGQNTVIYLYPPGGGNPLVATGTDRSEAQLNATGTWTILVEDLSLDSPGSYSLGLLNVTAGPLTNGSDPNGGAIGSSEVKTGQMHQVADFDAFTFSATTGDRVVFGALATGGASFDTNVTLYPPNGGPAEVANGGNDRLDAKLLQSGTYTVVIEDSGNDASGNYSVSLLNLTAGPLTNGSDTDGGTISSADVVSANFSSAPDFDAWHFTGTNGNRVLIAAVATSASGQNTVIYLYPPGGGNPLVATGTDRSEAQLNATGTWTILVEDLSLDSPGSYSLGLLNVTAGPLTNGSDPDGGAIGSSEVKTGQMHQVADFDAFTFSATTGDRVVFGALATGGASFDTNVTLYPPNGGPAEVANGGNDRLDAKLLQSGTYTVVIEDGGNDASGNYSVSLLNLTAGPLTNGSDTDGGTISSADVVSANFSSAPDFDAWHFTGTNGNRVLIAAVATSASGQNTVIYLYPPGGGNPLVATGTDRSEAQLNATGTWTILVEDLSLDSPGSYSLGLLNVTAGPLTNGSDPNGGAIGSSEVKTGQMHQVADFDAFTFSATTGDRVVFGALATGGASFDTNVTLYPPNGGPAEVANGGNDRLDAKLLQSGTYTVVIEDSGNDASGNYSVSLLNLTAGPLTNGSDTDGGTISSADVVSANFSSAPDFDAWHFTGTNGNRVLIAAVATSASGQNTVIYLYPPGGGNPLVATGTDRSEAQLNATGTWTILVEDLSLDSPGSYSLGLLNVTAGPLSNGSDPDGGAIGSSEVKTGQMHQVADFDAFTFSATTGDRVVFGALATGGASFDTNVTLYPPNGGPAEVANGGNDRLDAKLLQSGTYTVVIEDGGNDASGNYSVSLLNVLVGPHTNGSDSDGGPIVNGHYLGGTITPAPDFDAFLIEGEAGDKAIINAVSTSSINTTIYLYPPDGGNPVVATGNDNVVYVLTSSGTWIILIEDLNLDTTGTYNLNFTKTVATTDAPQSTENAFDRSRISLQMPYPNPCSESSSIRFSLPREQSAQLAIYDVSGGLVRELVDGTLAPGWHEMRWDGRDESGIEATSGTYYLVMRSGAATETSKVLRVR